MKDKIAVECKTQKEYDALMIVLEERGYFWCGKTKTTENDFWEYYEKETCVNLENDKLISFSSKEFYEKKKYTIISLVDFIIRKNKKYCEYCGHEIRSDEE